jgi:hypothetical protein
MNTKNEAKAEVKEVNLLLMKQKKLALASGRRVLWSA